MCPMEPYTDMQELLVYVGTRESSELVDAVVRGGGTPVDRPEDAEVLVWSGGDLADLKMMLHDDLAWVQLPSAGVERYLTAGVADMTCPITNASPAYADNVAEHTLAMILSCARQIHPLSRRTAWSTPSLSRLHGATVAIIGCGRIGRSLITYLDPFDVTVLASTRSGTPVPGASRTVVPADQDEIIGEADYVVVAAPATPETAQLIGSAELEGMKDSAYLINISRGSLVDTDALVAALERNTIAGAALDVTDPEPLPAGSPLWNFDSVLITPHVANPDAWDAQLLAPLVEQNVRRFVRGESLVGLVDTKLGY